MATAGSRHHESIDFIVAQAKKSISAVKPQTVDDFLQALAKASRVFVYGTGRSGQVARAFAVRLAHLGYSTYVIGETITAPVQASDLVVLVSGSGETYPVAMTAEIAKTIGARVAVLTANAHARVPSFADIVIEFAAAERNGRRKELAPLGTLFETTAWIFLDGVVADLMRRRRQNEEMMRQRHATLE